MNSTSFLFVGATAILLIGCSFMWTILQVIIGRMNAVFHSTAQCEDSTHTHKFTEIELSKRVEHEITQLLRLK